ncbi:Apc15p protein-domain-containing protein [Hypoxylon crocopeplum]|nr:Apc15p protein-domain-containing protein [Hypoxylon crocopeplum]
MLSLLPDLAPRDSHSLWYTSTRNPVSSTSAYVYDASPPNQQQQQQQQQLLDTSANASPLGSNSPHRRGAQHLAVERSLLARLRADEQNLERRRQNVTNFGAAWLKPPGIPKTLHHLREERREAEEHQEALRREQLAQELAEAEGVGAGEEAGDVDAILDDVQEGDEDGVMDDVQLDGARDLDEDIPEADAADFGLDSDDDDEDEEDDDDDDDDEEQDPDGPQQRAARTQQQQLMTQRMRQTDDAFRESMARGRDSANYYGVDEEVDDEDQAQMIEEDDLIGGDEDDGDMDADLDDEIPEAEDAGYEHTDSEADLRGSGSSSDDGADHVEMSFAAQASQPRYSHNLAQTNATRNSLAISDILSRDGSSLLGSSPQMRRQSSDFSRRGRG